MNGKPTLFLDQFGNRWIASTVRELREKIGGGRISKMYCDKKDGGTVQTGYVIGRHWCTAFRPIEIPV